MRSVAQTGADIGVVIDEPNFHFDVIILKNMLHLDELEICTVDTVVYFGFSGLIV